ncbi:MAG: hypothetical protein [Bacteriophage sp.]|nr:MAG: hypothetical protein [Bacteriophage sp.]
MANGKATEFKTSQLLRSFYRLNITIQRLPDKYDTGKFEDVRPSDFIVIGLGGKTSFVECKESEKLKTSFSILSTFRKGQVQGMRLAEKLNIPYYVVFNFLSTNQMFLVPSKEILNCLDSGKKSIPFKTIEQYPWTTGELPNL